MLLQGLLRVTHGTEALLLTTHRLDIQGSRGLYIPVTMVTKGQMRDEEVHRETASASKTLAATKR